MIHSYAPPSSCTNCPMVSFSTAKSRRARAVLAVSAREWTKISTFEKKRREGGWVS